MYLRHVKLMLPLCYMDVKKPCIKNDTGLTNLIS